MVVCREEEEEEEEEEEDVSARCDSQTKRGEERNQRCIHHVYIARVVEKITIARHKDAPFLSHSLSLCVCVLFSISSSLSLFHARARFVVDDDGNS